MNKGVCKLARACGHLAKGAIAALAIGTGLFARGESVTVGGGTITYEGAAATWLGSELVLTYTDASQAGSLTISGYAKVDYLVVGGGGAGGTMAGNGGGGGGGAGGYIYQQNAILTNAVYTVVVGAGGAAATDNTAITPGGDGGDSYIGEVVCAFGGGGGGAGTGTDAAAGAGAAGGSGGGGANKKAGGAASQGNIGGTSNSLYFGAGGGGAGSAGGSGTAKDRAGGAGISCSITGEDAFYAAGGAGGRSSSGTVALGGSLIGGNGGGYNNALAATAGAANTGSGGGGGGRTTPGAAGGSGIVVVRILDAVDAVPTPQGGDHPYDGTEQVMLERRDWLYTIEGTASATDVGSYTYTATLNPGLNLVWGDGTATSKTLPWSITQAENALSGLEQPGWRAGTAPSEPTCTVTFGTPVYTYSETQDGDYSTWDLTTLAPGTYFVKATVEETANYKGVEAKASFTVFDEDKSPLKELGRFARIALDAYTGETLTNFVLLVKISPDLIPGFDYRTAYLDGSDVRFCDREGRIYAHDIDAWDASGTSLAWVKIPEFNAETSLYMCWGPVAGETLAEADETRTWTDYAGVWHFSEEISAEAAATTASADATENGLDAVPTHGSGVDDEALARMVSTDGGILARARVIDTQSILNGNYLRVPYAPALDVTTNLTISYWVKLDANTPNTTHNVRFASRKTSYGNAGGWELELNAGQNLRLFGGSGSYFDAQLSASALADNPGYNFIAVAFSNTTASVYGGDPASGNFYETAGTIAPVSATTRDLAIGNNLDGNEASVCGALDEFRICRVTREKAWLEADYQQVTNGGYAAFSLASATQGVTFKNHWLVEPTFAWDDETKTATCDLGSAAAAGSTSSVAYFKALSGEEVSLEEAAATPGAYRVVVTATAKDYEDMSATFTFTVAPEVESYTAFSSASGRILLMNRDNNALGAVERQGYSDTSTSAETFWKRLNSAAVEATDTYNLKPGTAFELWTKDYGRKLWHLIDIRQGNTFPTGDTGSEPLMTNQNYLPWSETSFSIIDRMNKVGSNRKDVGQMVMRNSTDACVYSPLYDEGVGTIYFDAVNGWTDDSGENYRLVVQIATNCFADAEHLLVTNVPPTDAYLKEYAGEDPEATTDGVSADALAKFANWQSVTMTVLKRDGTSTFASPFTTNDLALAVRHGGTIDNFYRVYIDLYEQLGEYRGPVRFRIKRVSAVPPEDMSIDGGGFILLDNIIASYPAMRADLRPYGGDEAFCAEASGEQVLGWRNAFMTPFPSITDEGVRARGEIVYTTNAATKVDTARFVTTAKMAYRWRYLNQAFDPADASAWKSVILDPENGFAAPVGTFLDLPDTGAPGDIEFRYTLELNAPYYTYVDYSGANLGVPDYSERISAVTNAYEGASLAGKTRGSDWFVRLRDGASAFEGVTLVVSNSNDQVVSRPMTLVADDTWRFAYETPTNAAERLYFRVETVNPQTAGATAYNFETNAWRVALAEGSEMSIGEPATMVAAEAGSFGGELAVDATTGYLLFQVATSAEAPSVTIVHADWQNFNRWSDANGHDYVGTSTNYVGTSTDPTTMSGVSSAKRDWQQDFGTWHDMPATNGYWQAPSPTWTSIDNMYGRTAYEPFNTASSSSTDTADTTGAWGVGPGMWVSKLYHAAQDRNGNDAGVALQMQGQGKGYLQFVDNVEYPRGLDTLSFNARLAQSIAPENFVYYDGDTLLSLSNYTFTALAAFDQKGMTSFSGNASLSLVAHYVAGRGFYEARLEQYGASTNNGQRLVLYRWNRTKTNGKWRWQSTPLHTYNNPTSFSAPNSADAAHNPFYITVTNMTEGVYVMAGVKRAGLTPGKGTSETDMTNGNWWNIGYLDTSDERIPYGTYGLLSTSCEGVFLDLAYWSSAIAPFGNLHSDNTGEWSDKSISLAGRANRRPATGSDFWRNYEGRMEPFDESNEQWGIRAAEAMETLEIYTAPYGKDSWSLVASTNITGFGALGSDGTMGGASHYEVKLRTLDNCSVRIGVGGDEEDQRTDITLSDVSFTQWRGADWDDMTTALIPDYTRGIDARYANISFNAAWIKDHALLLSARRTKPGSPAAIYSPLMDDYEYEIGVKSGLGLGMIAFRYENAQTNANILVQIATNNISRVNFGADIDTFSADAWVTVTNYTFGGENAMPASGVISAYIGLHGVKGMMRIVVDDALVNAVAGSSDETAFGDITITEVLCSDEPELDARSWWGWNLRTVGDMGSIKDAEGRMLLADFDTLGGKSMALNNSVTEDIDESEADVYRNNLPFVQTPTFTNANVKIGAVSFKARKFAYTAAESADYGALNTQPAQVTLYGSKNGSDDDMWYYITDFAISNNFYKTYSRKFDADNAYRAFRLAVTRVPGVEKDNVDSEPALPDGAVKPVRVLIDDVLVSEAVEPRFGFRNFGTIRTELDQETIVENVARNKDYQPLCNESWGVQCEIYPAQLAQEIDFNKEINVYLHWFRGTEPWGYENWRTNDAAHHAQLALAEGASEANRVYRSSYTSCPDAIVGIETSPVCMQYMLEVEYYNIAGLKQSCTVLPSEWEKVAPTWYAPVDHNATNDGFSPFTLLDEIAPGWAWINEANIFGEYINGWHNSDDDLQYVEIAAPVEASLLGWQVNLLAQGNGGTVITNTIGTFGVGDLTAKKTNIPAFDPASENIKPGESKGLDPNMVFRVIANPNASQTMSYAKGEYDATWKTFENHDGMAFTTSDRLGSIYPFGVQLVRRSGVIEHEVVCVGTNFYGNSSNYSDNHPTNTVNYLNAHTVPGGFFFAGADDGGAPNSLSVISGQGEAPENWTNNVVRTPGRINKGQYINPQHPTPNGESIVVYAQLDQSGGAITQQIGDGAITASSQTLFIKKGSPVGTNITYRVEPWYELGSVTTNLAPSVAYAPATWVVNGTRIYTLEHVGLGASNNVTVIAKAQVMQDLADKYNLTDENRYTDAVIAWLKGGKTLRGDFANPDSDTIYLADFIDYNSNEVKGQIDLTGMYWLDIDPTLPWGDGHAGTNAVAFKGQVSNIQPSVTRANFWGTGKTLDNTILDVAMMMTNRVDKSAWAPYVLRGMEVASTSSGWAADPGMNNWTSVTFKVEGHLNNGQTSYSDDDSWVPMRLFVFTDASFDPATFTTKIELIDPKSEYSVGFLDSVGWYRWFQTHPGDTSGMCFRWRINGKSLGAGVEVLKKENTYE